MLEKTLSKIQSLSLKGKIIIFLLLFVHSFAWVLFRNPVYMDTMAYIFPTDDIGDARVYWGIRNGYNTLMAEHIPKTVFYQKLEVNANSKIIIESKTNDLFFESIEIENGISFHCVEGDIIRYEYGDEIVKILELPKTEGIQLLTVQNGIKAELYFSSIQLFFKKQLLNRDIATTFPFYLAYTADGNIAFDKSIPNNNLYDVSFEKRQGLENYYLDPAMPHYISNSFKRSFDFPFGHSKLLAGMSLLASFILTCFLFIVPYNIFKTFLSNETNKLLFIGLGFYLFFLWLLFRHTIYSADKGVLQNVIDLTYTNLDSNLYMINEYVFYLIGYSSRTFLALLQLCIIVYNYEKILSKYLLSNLAKAFKYIFILLPLLSPYIILTTVNSSMNSTALLWIILAILYFAMYNYFRSKKYIAASLICLFIGIAYKIDYLIFSVPFLIYSLVKQRTAKNYMITGLFGLGIIMFSFITGYNNNRTELFENGKFSLIKTSYKYNEMENEIRIWPGNLPYLPASSHSNVVADLPHKHNIYKWSNYFLTKTNSNIFNLLLPNLSIIALFLVSILFFRRLKFSALLNITFLIYVLFIVISAPIKNVEYLYIIYYYSIFAYGLIICETLKSGLIKKKFFVPANVVFIVLVFLVIYSHIHFGSADRNNLINTGQFPNIRRYIYTIILFLFLYINISFFKKKLFIICIKWKSTSGNHTGQAYDAKQIARKNGNFSHVINIYHLINFKDYSFFFQHLYKIIACYLTFVASKNDVLYLTEYFHHGSVLDHIYFAKRLHGRLKIIAMAHLIPQWIEDNYSKEKILEYSSYVDKLLVLGNSLRNFYLYKGVSSKKVIFVSLYVDNNYYGNIERKRKENKSLHAVIIGNMLRKHDEIIQIISLTPNIQYHVFSGREKLSIGCFDKFKNVIPHGEVKERELRSILHNSDISLNVMYDTVGSNVIVTSIASGLAMLCSDVGSIRDYVQPDSGILFNYVHEAVDALNQLDNDRGLLLEFQKKSLKKAKEIDINNFVNWLHNNIINEL